MATAAQKVSPSIDLAGAEAPLLDLATLAERVKAIETTPDAPTRCKSRATLNAAYTYAVAAHSS